MKKSLKTVWNAVGGLSRPSKMPCYSYSIPASRCKRGSLLAKVKGTVCSICYANKGNYRFPGVQIAMEKRYQSLLRNDWCANMAILINALSPAFFRWHDSGDLQGVWHLAKIAQVCLATPATRHWLPTREPAIIRQWIQSGNTIPENLTVRASSDMLDGTPPSWAASMQLPSSSASPDTAKVTCPSYKQAGKCLDCRKCWDTGNPMVVYKTH